MKALVKASAGPHNVDLVNDWPEPRVKPGWIVAEVIACWVCGTDLHILADEHKSWPPVVLGHEYVARITQVGPQADGWSVGDRIVCEQHSLACGHCHACRRGAIHLCPSKRSPGWGIDGAFAERVALPAALLHRVPDDVSDLAAAVTEPTAICLTALDRVKLAIGERLAVIGPGPIGLICALLARHAGVKDIYVVGRSSSAKRLRLAAELGFTTVSSDRADAARQIRERTDGGVDAAVETSGSGHGFTTAVQCCRSMGRVACLGISGNQTAGLDLDAAMSRSLTVHFSMSSEYSTWDRALRAMASGYDPLPLVTTYPLDSWKLAFDDVAARHAVKAVIVPGGVG